MTSYRLKQVDTEGLFEYYEAVEIQVGEKPEKYSLSQNYPNPFNPVTIIKYSIPLLSHVTLKIYNVLGREVAEIVNETQAEGSYYVRFDASNLASGLYFYSIRTDKFNSVKKMILAK